MPEFVENDAVLTLRLEGSAPGSTANNLTTTVEGYVLDARQGYVLDNKKLDKSSVANNLSTIEDGKALDARQGKWLDENKIGYSGIANDLKTDVVNKVLSAAQGKVLGEKVAALEKAINELPEIPEVTPESIGAATVLKRTAAFVFSNWSSAAPYTQTIEVDGVLSTDIPFIYDRSYSSDDASKALARHESWNRIQKIVAGNGTLTAYCYEEKPEYEIPINVVIVR